MMNVEAVNRFAEELNSRLAAITQAPLPSATLKSLIQESLARLDVVSRSDYERLLQIHQRTRSRVDELTKRVEALEKKQ